jgi:hypothetical protein
MSYGSFQGGPLHSEPDNLDPIAANNIHSAELSLRVAVIGFALVIVVFIFIPAALVFIFVFFLIWLSSQKNIDS